MSRNWNKPLNYELWRGMLRRCYDKTRKDYKLYGAKGIDVCARWFCLKAFNEDMGKRPTHEHTLDRIDGTKGYSKENCRWATRCEQNRNRLWSTSKAGMGVTFHKQSGKWQAVVPKSLTKTKNKYLGLFDSMASAECAVRNYKEPA